MASKCPTLDELAAAMNPPVNVRTLKGWKARGCPCTSIDAVKKWHANHVRPRKGGPAGPKTESDKRAESLQLRTLTAEAEKAEEDARGKKMENDKRAGLLVEKSEVIREAAEVFAAMRAILEAFPDAAAKEVPQQQRARIYDVARNTIDKTLRKLSQIHLLGGAHA